MYKALGTAVRTLTIIPLPGNGGGERWGASLLFFPLVGVTLGAVSLGAQAVAHHLPRMETLLWAILSVGIVTWLTGCIHVDGVGDGADAFGAGRGRDRVLEILKDSRHGTYGVCAIFFDLSVKTIMWNSLLKAGSAWVIVTSLAMSRCMQAAALAYIPNARPQTSAAAVFATPGAKVSACAGFAVSCICLFLYANPLRGAVIVAATVIPFAILSLYFMRRIGGITGDCVGVINECVEIAVLITGMSMVHGSSTI